MKKSFQAHEDRILLKDTELRLRRLSRERLRVANDFLAYLEEREEEEATRELLSLPDFEETLKRAVKRARVGQVKSFSDIRRDV